MPHLHTKPGQHDFTVSAYIIRTDFARPKLILHQHKKLNKLLQFGGHVELDENPWSALIHEIREESGYDLAQLKLLQPESRLKNGVGGSVLHPQPVCINTHPFNEEHFHIDIGYAFVTDQEPAHQLAADESQDIRLVSQAELLELGRAEIFDNVKDIANFIFDECLPNWEHISADAV